MHSLCDTANSVDPKFVQPAAELLVAVNDSLAQPQLLLDSQSGFRTEPLLGRHHFPTDVITWLTKDLNNNGQLLRNFRILVAGASNSFELSTGTYTYAEIASKYSDATSHLSALSDALSNLSSVDSIIPNNNLRTLAGQVAATDFTVDDVQAWASTLAANIADAND